MSNDDACEILERAGFKEDQVEALMQVFATHHHLHEMDDIIGLEEELEFEDEDE